MPAAQRIIKSFSLDSEVFREVERTKGDVSTSERVNRLLKVGLEIERRRSLSSEAAAFFATDTAADTEDRSDRLAFQEASLKAISRD